MEKRAVRISFEIWKDWLTQDRIQPITRCIYGLPEDARFVGAFYKDGVEGGDPVFVFAAEQWPDVDDFGHRVIVSPDGYLIPEFIPVFRVAECRTCEWWADPKSTDAGICVCGDTDKTLVTGQLLTSADFSCVQYEPRETDD